MVYSPVGLMRAIKGNVLCTTRLLRMGDSGYILHLFQDVVYKIKRISATSILFILFLVFLKK